MALDRIDIIVVTWNALSALQETLRSVVDLNDPRVSLCIVDGASNDGTTDYLPTLRHPWIRWSSEPEQGIFDAMNKGWKTVPDDHWILYLGAGDTILSLPGSEELAAASNQGCGVLLGHCMHGTLPVNSVWCDTLFYGCTLHHQAVITRKSVHPAAPFDTTFRAYADWEFNLRLFAAGVKACQIASFKSYADPHGITSKVHVGEAVRISFRHGGAKSMLKALRRHVPIRYWQLKHQFRVWLSLRSRLGLPPRPQQ